MTVSKLLPKVQISGLLRDDLEAEGYDPDDFAEYFAKWKALGSAGEYADPYFGKDAFYERPLRNKTMVLRHVHLRPDSDQDAVALWDWQHDNDKRKTSNAVLVYVFDPTNGYLLLHVVREPDGHKLSDMDTPETDRFMNQLADVAVEFIYNNEVGL
jgi:hypothetical protein